MANFDVYKPDAGSTSYVEKYDNFVVEVQRYAQELEDAAETEPTLELNLQRNYIGYTLASNISGNSNTYKCINMAPATDAQDYVTWEQAQSLVGGSENPPANVTDVGVGSLLANDILVVNAAGTAITGRPCSYQSISNGATAIANKNYDMGITTGTKTVYMPASPSDGTTISFADIQGNITAANKLVIGHQTTGQAYSYIMGMPQNETLVIDAYPHCSFDLVYSGITAFGWTLARFQM